MPKKQVWNNCEIFKGMQMLQYPANAFPNELRCSISMMIRHEKQCHSVLRCRSVSNMFTSC